MSLTFSPPGSGLATALHRLARLRAGAGATQAVYDRGMADSAAGALESARRLEARLAAVRAAPSVPQQAATGATSLAPSSPATGGLDDWIRQAERLAGVGEDWTPGLRTIAMRESGGNPRAINRTDINAQQGHPSQGLFQCVSLRTQALTRRGWLTHDEVVVGDETIGYNPLTERSEWTPITKVVHYEAAPVWRVGNRGWHAEVTPNHRWWSDTTVGDTAGRHRGEFVRTDQFGPSRHRLRLAAPADTEGIVGLSTEDAAVLAWLQGDGHIRAEAGSYDGMIYQSKPEMVTRLRALLAHIEHTETVRPPRPPRPGRGGHVIVSTLAQYTFRLRRAYVTDLVKRSGLIEIGPEAMVLALSPDQRAAWLGAMIDAEGHRQPGKRPGYSEFVRIAQVDGPLQDAIRLAVYLEGWRPTFSTLNSEARGFRPARHIGMAGAHVSPSMFQPRTLLDAQPVWCVKTALETWTARLDDQLFLTGNTIPSTFKAHALPGHGDINDPVANGIAAIRYILGRYKGINNVPGLRALAAGRRYVGY